MVKGGGVFRLKSLTSVYMYDVRKSIKKIIGVLLYMRKGYGALKDLNEDTEIDEKLQPHRGISSNPTTTTVRVDSHRREAVTTRVTVAGENKSNSKAKELDDPLALL